MLFRFFIERGVTLHLNKLKFPLPKDALCQVYLKFANPFWRRRWMCKVFDKHDNDDDDNGQILIRKAHDPSAQVSEMFFTQTIGLDVHSLQMLFLHSLRGAGSFQ